MLQHGRATTTRKGDGQTWSIPSNSLLTPAANGSLNLYTSFFFLLIRVRHLLSSAFSAVVPSEFPHNLLRSSRFLHCVRTVVAPQALERVFSGNVSLSYFGKIEFPQFALFVLMSSVFQTLFISEHVRGPEIRQ